MYPAEDYRGRGPCMGNGLYTGDFFMSTGLEQYVQCLPSSPVATGKSASCTSHTRLAGNSGCHFIWLFLHCNMYFFVISINLFVSFRSFWCWLECVINTASRDNEEEYMTTEQSPCTWAEGENTFVISVHGAMYNVWANRISDDIKEHITCIISTY